MTRCARAKQAAVLAVGCACVALVSAAASADVSKGQCVDANSNAQALRLDGKLEAARRELQTCGDPSCPAIVRADCAQRLDDLERAEPTIVFDAKDAAGSDLIAVTVTLDGRPLTDKLDGTALRIDPGEHTFTFAVLGQPIQSRTFVLKEGEKRRRERIVIGEAHSAMPASPTPVPSVEVVRASSAASPSRGIGSQKVAGLALGGLGIAGVAVGSVFGLMTFSAASAQKNACMSSANCANRDSANSDHSSGSTFGGVSTAAFIAGGALLAAGVTLFLTAPRRAETGVTGTLVPSFAPDSAGAAVRGTF